MAETRQPTPEFAPNPTPEVLRSSYQLIDERIDGPNGVTLEPGETVKPLNIVILGAGKYTLGSITSLEGSGHNIVGIFGPPKLKTDTGYDPLREYAQEREMDNKWADMKDPAVIDGLKEKRVDLIIGAGMTGFVPNAFAEIALCGAWGAPHYSQLVPVPEMGKNDPGYRGLDAPKWQVLNGMTEIGLSMNAYGRDDDQIDPDPNNNIDAALPLGSQVDSPTDTADKGPILSVVFEKRDEDTSSTSALFSKKLSPAGSAQLVRVVNLVSKAKDQGKIYRGQKQVRGSGNYQPIMQKGDVALDFNTIAENVHNHIEAGSFNPGAYALHKGVPITLYDSEAIEGETQTPGRVTVSEKEWKIDTALGRVRVRSGRTGELVTKEDGTVIEINKTRPTTEMGELANILGVEDGTILESQVPLYLRRPTAAE